MVKLDFCPNIGHPDWIRAEKELDKDHALLIYDKLGDRPPSETELKLIKDKVLLTPSFNQRVWDTNRAEDLISRDKDGKEEWHTVEGKREPILKNFLDKKATTEVAALRRKYYDDKIGFEKHPIGKIDGKERYEIRPFDKKFVEHGIEELHLERNAQREDIANEQSAMDKEAQVKLDEVGNVMPDVDVKFPEQEPVTKKIEVQQDRKSYYRGQIDTPEVDKSGNLILYGRKDNLYTRAGIKDTGISMTEDLESAIEYGNGQLEVSKNLASETYDAENELNRLSENGYWLIQIPKGVREVVKEAGEVKVLGDKIIIPKGDYVIEHILPDESRKLKGVEQMPSETRRVAEEKVKHFQKVIPQIQDVIYDETLPSIAALEPGGRAMRVNPTLLASDTIGHEFGHMLIDLLGGMSNPLNKMGREQLKGTDIEKAVMAAYPDLVARGDDRIDKEILTTAVGRKAAEIFKDQDLENKWARWAVRFVRRARATLGIESSAVLKLANKLVSGTPLGTKETASNAEVKDNMFIQGKPSFYEQNSQRLDTHLTLINDMLKKEEDFQKRAALALQKKMDVYSKQGRQTEAYKSLEETLPRIQGTDPTKGLVHMIRFAVQSTKEMNDKYISYLKQDRFPKEGNKEKITVKLLSEWRNSVASWDMLEELRQLYDSTRNQVAAFGEESDTKALKMLMTNNKGILEATMGEKQFKAAMSNKNTNILDLLVPMLDDAIGVKNNIQKLYIEKGKELTVDYLFPYVNHVKVWKREEYEREWLAMSDAERESAGTRADYIANKITENMPKIEQDTRDLIMRELIKCDGDVGYMTRMLDSVLNSKDVISSALARSVYTIHEKSHVQSIEWHGKFLDRLEPLERQLGRTVGMPDEKFWHWLLEDDPDNKGRVMQSIIGTLPSKLEDDYYEFSQQVWSDTYKDNNGNKPSDDAKGRIIRAWREKNAPRDRESWLKAQEEAATELHNNKLITDKELKKFISNSKVKTSSSRQPLTKLFSNQDAIDVMDSFSRRNEWSFRKPSGYYDSINSKWHALEAMRKSNPGDERVKFYDFLQEVLDEAASRIPGMYALTNELPSMMKTVGQRYRSTGGLGMSKADFLKSEFSSMFQKKSTDTDRGMLDEQGNPLPEEPKEKGVKEKTQLVNEANEPVNFLPIYFTQNKTRDKGKRLPMQDQSFDVASLYYNYLKMAIDFGNKYDALAEIEMTNYFINHRDVIRRDGKGNIYTDATAKKLLHLGDNIRDKALTSAGTSSMIAAQMNDFIKHAIYGMSHDEEPDINIFGYTIDRAKLLNTVTRFTSMNMLGLNFIGGLATFNVVEANRIIESSSGQYYNMKDARHATGTYYKNLGGMMKDIGARRPENVVTLLNQRFDTMSEEVDGKLNTDSKFAHLMNTNTLFFTLHTGLHYVQTRVMLAMLNHVKAEGEGVEGSILDNYKVNPETKQLEMNPKVTNWSMEDQISFSARMHRIIASAHGDYSFMGQVAVQRTSLGRMALLFRKFVTPGFQRRWAGKQVNNLMDDTTEGYYRTFGHFAKQFMTDLIHFKFEAMQAYGRGMTEGEKANLMRFTTEVSLFAVTAVLCGIAMRAKKEDPDKNDAMLNNLAFQALRLRSELAFYIDPASTLQILRSPMASLSIFEGSLKLVGQLMYPVYSGTGQFQSYQVGYWKGHLKLEKTVNQLLPVYKQFTSRVQNMGAQLSYFNQ